MEKLLVFNFFLGKNRRRGDSAQLCKVWKTRKEGIFEEESKEFSIRKPLSLSRFPQLLFHFILLFVFFFAYISTWSRRKTVDGGGCLVGGWRAGVFGSRIRRRWRRSRIFPVHLYHHISNHPKKTPLQPLFSTPFLPSSTSSLLSLSSWLTHTHTHTNYYLCSA